MQRCKGKCPRGGYMQHRETGCNLRECGEDRDGGASGREYGQQGSLGAFSRATPWFFPPPHVSVPVSLASAFGRPSGETGEANSKTPGNGTGRYFPPPGQSGFRNHGVVSPLRGRSRPDLRPCIFANSSNTVTRPDAETGLFRCRTGNSGRATAIHRWRTASFAARSDS